MSDLLDTLDLVALGRRLTTYRTHAGLSLQSAAQELGCSVEHVEGLESGTVQVAADEILMLATLYGKEGFDLVNEPYPPMTQEQVLQALRAGEIPEETAASFLNISLLDVRRLLKAALDR